MLILDSEKSGILRQQYIQTFVNSASHYYIENIERKTRFSDGLCYTGYLWEEIQDLPFMKYVDVLVDGRFVEALKDISLRFRGSSNQRLIDMKKTLASGEIVLLPDLDRKPGQA